MHSKGKETMNKTKRQPMEWDKIFENDVTGKGLISKIYKQLLQLNITKTKSLIKKWAEQLNKYFSKQDIQIANRHLKKCSTSLIRGMQINTTMRYHLTPGRMVTIKMSKNNKCWTSLVAQGLRIHLPMQGTQVWALAGKIPHATDQLSPCTTTADPGL